MTLGLSKPVVILDASCLINLYASGHIERILASLQQSITVSAYVHKAEALWVRRMVDGEPIKEQIDLTALINQGLISVAVLEGENESNLHLYFSGLIRDEGESRTGAIAVERDWAIGIDDRKARRVIAETSTETELVYTVELLKHWAETDSVSAEELQSALRSIRYDASYLPRKANPLYAWWVTSGGPI